MPGIFAARLKNSFLDHFFCFFSFSKSRSSFICSSPSPIEIISKDGTKKINTNHYIEVEEDIIKDIKNNELKTQYKAENKIQNVKSIHGGYAVEEKDSSKINDFKKKLENTNQELLKQ